MARINLLPWRDQLRKQQQQEFLAAILASMGFACLIMIFVHVHYSDTIEYQNQRNLFLTERIAELDKQIEEIKALESKKNRLISKMEVIEQLQISRPEIVHFFVEMAKSVPEGVQLHEIAQADRSIQVKGEAQSNARVSSYMNNVEASPWLEGPELTVIESRAETKEKTVASERVNRFDLKLRQTDQQAKEKEQKTNKGNAKKG
ncbi:MAG TPA: PilN domain-containing protein [Methylococcaceae bacterium]|nr:PilN domain-containing protein [Methylococcaceae bacterium]